MIKVLVSLIGLYVVLVAAGCAVQRRFIYYPQRIDVGSARQLAGELGLEAWHGADGKLLGWRDADRGQARPPALLMHGNAGFALHRAHYVELFREWWQVHLLEYPGYGVAAHGQRPSEAALVQAAEQALLQLEHEFPGEPVYLVGESLGTGVAAHLAGRRPERVAGLLLITPFSSLAEVATKHFPLLPVRLILRDRYNSVKSLSNYQGRVFILIAGQDEVVPAELGLRLYESYTGPKQMVRIDNAGHNTVISMTTDATWRRAILFLQK